MAWDTLVFDFTMEVSGTSPLNLANTYDKASIFFNFGTSGAMAGQKTYYWDDVEFLPGSGGPIKDQIDLPVTFEDTATVNYDLTDFGGNVSMLVVDPTDPNNLVAESVKTDMAELWAGTSMGTNGFANAIPFTAMQTKMRVSIWSPDAGIPIRLKVEDASDPMISVETETNTTVAMAWDTLEFDFSNEVMGTPALNLANTYDKASIFFNFGTTGAMAGEKTYYWDDVYFGGIVINVDPEPAADHNIQMYPNPADVYFNVELPENMEITGQITVIDAVGRVVSQQDVQQRITRVSTATLQAGTYFVLVQNNDGQFWEKVVIE